MNRLFCLLLLSGMALITISGFPCSGKSQRAHELSQYMACRIQGQGAFHSVQVISDDVLGLQRSVYDGMPCMFPDCLLICQSAESYSEKPARGTLFTAVQRALAPGKIVILDSLNYIKGFRYQLYCAAREARCRVCTVCSILGLSHNPTDSEIDLCCHKT